MPVSAEGVISGETDSPILEIYFEVNPVRVTGSVDGEKNDNKKSNNNRFGICFIHELTIDKAMKNAQTFMHVRSLLIVFPIINFISLIPQAVHTLAEEIHISKI